MWYVAVSKFSVINRVVAGCLATLSFATLSISALSISALSLAAAAGAETRAAPLTDADFHPVDPDWSALGQLLFFDPLLSGNRNIACATCHHPSLGTSDAMSLSLGEGGIGLGPARRAEAANLPKERIPRNAPALFNLGARDITVMFHDGRVENRADAPFGIAMPEGRDLERPLPHALAAQTILPILSPAEMSGHPGENDVADAVAADRIRGQDGAWDILADRINMTPGYRQMFDRLIGDAPVHITDIATALSSFIATEFRATNSIFDRFLAGEVLMPDDAMRGWDLFTGKAGCAGCHSGPLLTDNDFHAIAMPQIGPGKDSGDSYFRDTGRFAVTGDPADRYRFRTPSLRNVGLTAPYGHDGAFGTLESVVRHHLNPLESLRNYGPEEAALHGNLALDRDDFAALVADGEIEAIAAANELAPVALSAAEIADIIAFLQCLTDPISVAGRSPVPASVPSGLALDIQN